MRTERSRQLFARAQTLFPGGVNSPVRAYGAVNTDPLCIARGQGAYLFDADNNRYIDYVGSWGPLILGHANPVVVEAIAEAAKNGTSFGATTAAEIELAELIVKAMPTLERLRFVNSGTEATMSAIRLARGATNRQRIIKFAGCYHGHSDALLVDETGSGLATQGLPGSAGVPANATVDTLTLPYNDLEAVEKTLQAHRSEVAAIIVEPIACNMGMVLPNDDFLPGLRKLCDAHGTLLIFDEVITGFRVGLGGAQQHYQVRPDLTTLGKIIGGGMPVGAYGGRVDLMNQVAPLGPVYQAGTLSGNPLAMAAGRANLQQLFEPGFYQQLEVHAQHFENGLQQLLSEFDHPAHFSRCGSIFYLWFKNHAQHPARNYHEIKQLNADAYADFFGCLLSAGVAFAPSAFEVGFISAAHTTTHLDATLGVIRQAMQACTQAKPV